MYRPGVCTAKLVIFSPPESGEGGSTCRKPRQILRACLRQVRAIRRPPSEALQSYGVYVWNLVLYFMAFDLSLVMDIVYTEASVLRNATKDALATQDAGVGGMFVRIIAVPSQSTQVRDVFTVVSTVLYS